MFARYNFLPIPCQNNVHNFLLFFFLSKLELQLERFPIWNENQKTTTFFILRLKVFLHCEIRYIVGCKRLMYDVILMYSKFIWNKPWVTKLLFPMWILNEYISYEKTNVIIWNPWTCTNKKRRNERIIQISYYTKNYNYSNKIFATLLNVKKEANFDKINDGETAKVFENYWITQRYEHRFLSVVIIQVCRKLFVQSHLGKDQ